MDNDKIIKVVPKQKSYYENYDKVFCDKKTTFYRHIRNNIFIYSLYFFIVITIFMVVFYA
jgi:ABC-type maltose transport system permease subunit